MIMKISVRADTTAIIRSYFSPSAMSLNVAAVPPRYTLASDSEDCFNALLRGAALGVDPRDAFRRHRIALMGDEEPRRLTVRRQEHSQTCLEVRVMQGLRRQVEEVVVLRASKLWPMTIAVLLIASIWSIIALNVW